MNRHTSDDHTMARRRFLGGLAVAAVPLIAGCAQVNSIGQETFVAPPATVSQDAAGALGFEEIARDQVTTTVQGRTYGVDVDATITSHYAVYEQQTDDGDGLTIGFLSTPKANVMFEERNPLAELSAQRLLYDEQVNWFREPTGLVSIDSVWNRNSTRLFGNRIDVLGESMFLTSRAGFASPDGDTAVAYVHYGKVELDDTVVFACAIRQWPVETTDRPYVGEDGYLSEAELDADVDDISAVFGSLRLE